MPQNGTGRLIVDIMGDRLLPKMWHRDATGLNILKLGVGNTRNRGGRLRIKKKNKQEIGFLQQVELTKKKVGLMWFGQDTCGFGHQKLHTQLATGKTLGSAIQGCTNGFFFGMWNTTKIQQPLETQSKKHCIPHDYCANVQIHLSKQKEQVSSFKKIPNRDINAWSAFAIM